jgi:hypothetical protein
MEVLTIPHATMVVHQGGVYEKLDMQKEQAALVERASEHVAPIRGSVVLSQMKSKMVKGWWIAGGIVTQLLAK